MQECNRVNHNSRIQYNIERVAAKAFHWQTIRWNTNRITFHLFSSITCHEKKLLNNNIRTQNVYFNFLIFGESVPKLLTRLAPYLGVVTMTKNLPSNERNSSKCMPVMGSLRSEVSLTLKIWNTKHHKQ